MANFLRAKWENIIMANYKVPVDVLMDHLPYGLELDLFEGNAYISLVGFMFKDSRLFNIPIPKFGTFEEVNLRFYVKRTIGNEVKRGVVFINETVPYKSVAWLANKLYNEHYTVVKTDHTWIIDPKRKQINYNWSINNKVQRIYVEADNRSLNMKENSFEEFIFEHYYGYTKINDTITDEYEVSHPRWRLNSVMKIDIQCDFKLNYGNSFAFLNNEKPTTVFIAEGSKVEIKWKRNKIRPDERR